MCYQMKEEYIEEFKEYLCREEKSQGTVEKYCRDIRAFRVWLAEREICAERAAEWKHHLIDSGYAPVTINSMLSALNGFFLHMGWEECRVKFLRIQRCLFREESKELTKEEYERLVKAAVRLGCRKTELLLETICSTGIRVSELRYITVEAARAKKAVISLKGKIRTIFLPEKLCRKLLAYAGKNGIASGEIFLAADGKGISRQQVWREMKALCVHACVEPSKVFPHNLRHLFAITFYKTCRDVVKVADVLGHSSVETTRIYLIATGTEHILQLNRLGLVV